ncbi:MAG: hypothetical protein KJ915_02255, partial [Candidatus Omnitrophica bacterium]|nr:hypothetical protein [Candidatus Omnitrophota bacterium]
ALEKYSYLTSFLEVIIMKFLFNVCLFVYFQRAFYVKNHVRLFVYLTANRYFYHQERPAPIVTAFSSCDFKNRKKDKPSPLRIFRDNCNVALRFLF